MPKLPVSIGKYKITGRLGKGGMSILYLAEHPSLGTAVVLKKLTLKGDSAHRERFRREATLMMKLRHENVVGVYDHFKEGGSHYLVMEFVDGRPLSELMAREGALPETEARWLAGRIAKALAHIHSRGIVHRDLKPSNVLLGRDGGVKLGDFGIAFTPGGDDDITSEGTALGTPTFMAPEQLEDARGADERSDMWSFGVCLFEMLTGRKFVTGPSPAAVREALPAAVKTMFSRLPPKLPRCEHRLLGKTLRMKPETRLKDGKAALRILGASGHRDIPPETLQIRLNELLLSMEGVSEPTPKAEITPDKKKPEEKGSGGLSPLRSLKIKTPGLLRGTAVVLIFFLAVLFTFSIIPGAWNTVFRRNSYGVFKLKLVYPAEAPEHWLSAASVDVYSEGENSLSEIVSPPLRISTADSSLHSRRITLPAGAYRIRWSLGDRVSWYSFRLLSFSALEKSGKGMMILEETLEGAAARHACLADAVRAAVRVWSTAGAMEMNALIPEQAANGVTTIRVNDSVDVNALQDRLRADFGVAIGSGLGAMYGKAFRIGHMGYVSEPMILGALASIETAFQIQGIAHGKGGVMAAIDALAKAKA